MSSPMYAGESSAPAAVSPEVPQPKQSNGFAIAALIFGIIGGSVLGLIFGFLGISKAKKIGTGKGMSIAGILLSILWLVAQIGIVVYVVSHVSKALDPGCVAAKAFILDDSKMNLQSGDPATLKTSLGNIVAELKADAAKSNNADAKAAIDGLANDFQSLLDSLNSGTAPSPALEAQLQQHANAIDTACGTIGT